MDNIAQSPIIYEPYPYGRGLVLSIEKQMVIIRPVFQPSYKQHSSNYRDAVTTACVCQVQ
jgi:hypothetical protein